MPQPLVVLDKAAICCWLIDIAQVLEAQKAYLTELDAAIGDADHGVNIARGFGAVAQKLPALHEQTLDALFKDVAMTLMSTVGGASGMLYAAFFMRAGPAAVGHQALDAGLLVHVLQSGRAGILERGRAALGDKTMIDVWMPAVDALAAAVKAGDDLLGAMAACDAAAQQGLEATRALQARKGRASYLGPRSIGHLDPGAASSYFILHALLGAAQAAAQADQQ